MLPDAPKNVAELTLRTENIARKFITQYSNVVSLGNEHQIPENILDLLFRNDNLLKIISITDKKQINLSYNPYSENFLSLLVVEQL